jgi:glutamate:GABA antiporter
VDTIATVAQGGGEAFTWMMIFAVVFFVPQALLFAELGAAFPQGGGPYFWTRLAFGHLAGAVNNFLYWITNPVWIGGTLTISCRPWGSCAAATRTRPARSGCPPTGR